MNKIALTVLVLVLSAAASYALFFRDAASPALGKETSAPMSSVLKSPIDNQSNASSTSEFGPPVLE